MQLFLTKLYFSQDYRFYHFMIPTHEVRQVKYTPKIKFAIKKNDIGHLVMGVDMFCFTLTG